MKKFEKLNAGKFQSMEKKQMDALKGGLGFADPSIQYSYESYWTPHGIRKRKIDKKTAGDPGWQPL